MAKVYTNAPFELNGHYFEPRAGCNYLFDYCYMMEDLRDASFEEKQQVFQNIIKEDLWFIVFFVMGVGIAQHPFWVNACNEVQEGPKTGTLDVWARFHGKSSIITCAETIQRIMIDPEQRICIFSWKNSIAFAFLRQIRKVFEDSGFLKSCFPHVLYEDPVREADKWSEELGIYVKRKGLYKEPTLMGAGLTESMPTSFHFTGRIYDDIMTEALANSPELIQKVKDSFDLSHNLGTGSETDWLRIVGTPYHHDDVIMYIKDLMTDDGTPMYQTRMKPATVDGTFNGESAYLPEKILAGFRANRRLFSSQQLLNPTAGGLEKLSYDYIVKINADKLPNRLYKFMLIDAAGKKETEHHRQDAWAIFIVGVEPYRDEIGLSNVYILDMCIEVMEEVTAFQRVVEMYMKHGRILKLAVEKVGMSSTEVHIANYLRAKSRFVSVENGRLHILRPAGRDKHLRIEQALSWPLANGRIHMLNSIPGAFQERLKMEMNKFPRWKDDGLDGLSYLYDLLKDYKFPKVDSDSDVTDDEWDRRFKEAKEKERPSGWMVQ